MRTAIAVFVFVLATSAAASAQRWADVQRLPANTPVRIEELGGKRGHAEGLLHSVEEVRLTILKGRNLLIIPKSRIAKVMEKRGRDPVWEGMAWGALYAAVSHGFAGEPAKKRNTLRMYVAVIAFGAVIDWGIEGKRTVYRTP
jgi:hypothetical protein